MYRRILVATDGTALAAKAVDHALNLAKSVGAKVVALTVTELWSISDMATMAELGDKHPVDEYEEVAESEAHVILEAVADKAKAQGVDCELVHVPDSRPADAILRTATDKGCDLIVLSTHARTGLARLIVGSAAADVVAESKVPVLICR